MTDCEEVLMPPHPRDASEYDRHIWCMVHPKFYLDGLGPNGLDMLVKTVAMHLFEDPHVYECVVWAYLDMRDSLHYLSFVFPSGAVASGIKATLVHDLVPTATYDDRPVDSEAQPVLKRRADGTLIRLWPAPGPGLSAKQTITVDWATFPLYNRVYCLRPGR